MPHRLLLLSVLVAGCSTDPGNPGTEPGPDAAMPSGDVTQLAPEGHAAISAWLAEGHYLAWACEDDPHPARPPGAHGTNRICSNTALSRSAAGAYPIGSVAVKELYRGDVVSGFAVARKLADGDDGANWYWYEAYGSSVIADGRGVGLCVNCHEGAPRDFVFTRVE